MKMRWQNYVIVVSFVGGLNVFFFLFFFLMVSLWNVHVGGLRKHLQYFKPFQASIRNQSRIDSNSSSKLPKVCMGAEWGYVLGPFLQNCSQLCQKCALKMCRGAPKPNLNPILLYNTSVQHSWVSAKPFKATLIFFICSLVKVKKEKGDKRLRVLTQPWQMPWLICL